MDMCTADIPMAIKQVAPTSISATRCFCATADGNHWRFTHRNRNVGTTNAAAASAFTGARGTELLGTSASVTSVPRRVSISRHTNQSWDAVLTGDWASEPECSTRYAVKAHRPWIP